MSEVIKGFGDPQMLTTSGWNILREEVSLPIAVISQSAITNNARWMAEFCNRSGVQLAPHGKTTMAPALFKTQLEAGAWGITLATVPQVMNAVNNGIKRIILANQLVGKFHFQQIANMLRENEVEFYCFADSTENLHQLGGAFENQNVQLNILLEIGVPNGRCGWRNIKNVNELIAVIEQYPNLKLAGIGFYEGVIHGENADEQVQKFVESVFALADELNQREVFSLDKPIITGAGSAWYDIVASTLNQQDINNQFNLIVRPGCYLIHDTGIYQEAQDAILKRSELACDITGSLSSSLTLWAYIVSVPEDGLAIVGLGKRDVAFDAGLPTPELFYSIDNQAISKVTNSMQVCKIMDQHCMLEFDNSLQLKVGDIVCFSTSHPCLTFDKWREIAVADDNWVVRTTLSTYF